MDMLMDEFVKAVQRKDIRNMAHYGNELRFAYHRGEDVNWEEYDEEIRQAFETITGIPT